MRLARRRTPVGSAPLLVDVVPPTTLPAETELERMFCETFRRFQPGAKAFAERYLSREDAKDACADAVAEIWLRWRDLRPDQRTDGFFFGVLFHKVVDARRAVRAVVTLEEAEEQLEWRVASESAVREQAAVVAELLDETVAAMPPKRRAAFHLVREEEFTYKEVAATMRVSEATVNRHITLGNADIRAAFEREGYRLAGGARPALSSPTTDAPGDAPGDAPTETSTEASTND